ncbi:MAG: AAA family ATPase [Candidatus Aminicenantes bacterium]|nr:AAA family ATPase [Candidatus Aminicenantes bacterium]NIM84856.1 AAA family ATPase [Candidatus Aminicenantes bacterium]NIN24364.1 AAA family ATPase [Candidatus Aminicenantes bacterium]NIN48128.1 AAA family ATPase [Candidatus Aminicenantes bacterium]NIN91026.1 AAA family ATPase [Candidatus Aminicenantes bacterium]
MFEELDIHNQFNESITRYKEHDPHLKRLSGLPLVYHSPLLDEPIFDIPGIYLITGGRQIGKTTFLKQFILKLLTEKNIVPKAVLFISGEIIDTHHILRRIINRFYDESIPHQFLFIDEVNYIPDWDKSVKYLADAGILNTMSVILTGSDNRIIRTSMKRFAGRRGAADKTDFDFFPLSFKEFVCLREKELEPLCKEIGSTPVTAEIPGYENRHHLLTELLYEYLVHGGYLPAINEFRLKGTISKSVMNTYIQWIIGDILKHNKNEDYLFEIFKGITATYNTQVSWNNLGRYLSIEHHKTIADYCNVLVSMHVLHIQEAIIEHKLTGAPKKNRKIYFRDPFIHHAVSNYLEPELSIDRIKQNLKDNRFASSYIEAAAVDHCKRWAPTYYIKGSKGEVDIVLVQGNSMFPVEVKWTTNIRPEDLKQVQNYKNGIILSPRSETTMLKNNVVLPLTRFLIHTGYHRLLLE